MNTYTRKGDIKIILAKTIAVYDNEGFAAFNESFHDLVLGHKVKFPLLEFCARSLTEILSPEEQILFCDEVCRRKTEGGNVILGILLQDRLATNFSLATRKATEYIADANDWYVCDIIGERVWGVGLLNHFEDMLAVFEKLRHHESNWVVRSLGAGGHYAIKKRLEKEKVEQVFKLLMQMCDTKDRQIRQGVGWAAKTTAKFHPDLISKYDRQLQAESIPNWFRNKITIGLNRYHYAQRN